MKNDRFHVLIVEDKIAYHPIYESELSEAFDCEISFAVNGQEAIDIISDSTEGVDLLLLDLNIPVVNGEEVLQFARSQPQTQNIPVIILTGDSSDETQIKLLQMGASDFIVKGGHPEILLARISAHMKTAMALDTLSQTALETDMFSAGVLHDIRNLQTSLSAMCDLVQMKLESNKPGVIVEVNSDLEKLKEKIGSIGKYASEIISSIKNKQTEASLEPVELGKIIGWCENALQSPGETENEALTVDYDPDSLEKVYADHKLIKMVFLNILQNAKKYKRPDTPSQLTVTQEVLPDPKDQNKKKVRTYLRDNGKGLKKGELKKIFQPFSRGSSVSKEAKGFGLGLSMVSRIVAKMHGSVWAELPPEGLEPGLVIILELESPKD